MLQLVGDPRSLPDWAPAFALVVEPDGQHWLIDSGEGQFRIRVHVSPEHGTVDLLPPKDPGRGARIRVLNNEDGSEFVLTLVFPAGADEESITRQMTTVEAELRTVRDLCEAQASAVA